MPKELDNEIYVTFASKHSGHDPCLPCFFVEWSHGSLRFGTAPFAVSQGSRFSNVKVSRGKRFEVAAVGLEALHFRSEPDGAVVAVPIIGWIENTPFTLSL